MKLVEVCCFEGVSSATAREFQDFLSFKKSVPSKQHTDKEIRNSKNGDPFYKLDSKF